MWDSAGTSVNSNYSWRQTSEKVTLLWPPSGQEGGKSGLWCVEYGRVVCYSKHAWYLLPAAMLCAFLRMGGLNSRQVGI